MGLIQSIGRRKTYLDSNIFIYAVETISPYSEALAPFFGALQDGTVEAVTSELTLAEVLVKPFRTGNIRQQQVYARAIRTHGGLTVIPVTREILLEAAHLRGIARFKLPDTIHIATARMCGCTALLSNDTALADAPEIDLILPIEPD